MRSGASQTPPSPACEHRLAEVATVHVSHAFRAGLKASRYNSTRQPRSSSARDRRWNRRQLHPSQIELLQLRPLDDPVRQLGERVAAQIEIREPRQAAKRAPAARETGCCAGAARGAARGRRTTPAAFRAGCRRRATLRGSTGAPIEAGSCVNRLSLTFRYRSRIRRVNSDSRQRRQLVVVQVEIVGEAGQLTERTRGRSASRL